MDERTTKRFAIDLKVETQVEGEPLRLFLLNLSCKGCLIDSGRDCLEEGMSIEFSLQPQIVVSGQVVWVRDGHAGVSFNDPVHEAVVLNLGFKPNAKAESFRDAFGRRLPQQVRFSQKAGPRIVR